MKAKDFLTKKLNELTTKVEDIQIRYEFRVSTQSHLIEITPLIVFEENELYMQEEANLEAEFEQLYPTENIVFISKGSLTEIQNVEFEFGYDKICFISDTFDIDFELIGYNEIIEAGENNFYALAA